MKKLIGLVAALALALAISGFFAVRLAHPFASRASWEKETPVEIAAAEIQGDPQPIAIPETTITLKHDLQSKDSAGNPGLFLKAGTQLITESTQGLDYIVSRDGRTFRIRCDDAFEKHGRFTNGQVEQLAVQMAAEIRAAGKAPTNERIVSRALEALEQQRLNASFTDPASLVDSLQRALLVDPSADLDVETPSPPSPKPD